MNTNSSRYVGFYRDCPVLSSTRNRPKIAMARNRCWLADDGVSVSLACIVPLIVLHSKNLWSPRGVTRNSMIQELGGRRTSHISIPVKSRAPRRVCGGTRSGEDERPRDATVKPKYCDYKGNLRMPTIFLSSTIDRILVSAY